ncbi:hypothetical protein AB0F43_10980 [Kribbella sp. NPDC023972]|uniref:hypothetical protein n=1 Tax=Kribbella sp. NPDC023972 TaxID=3154795 RepID=UPI0033E36C09
MATVQSEEEIRDLLTRLVGEKITGFQVLGINSLKSLAPPPDAVVGEVVSAIEVAGRILRLQTIAVTVTVDLQRVGKLVWLKAAEPFRHSPGVPMPTVRLLLEGGAGLDLTEPAKTKRITVALTAGS